MDSGGAKGEGGWLGDIATSHGGSVPTVYSFTSSPSTLASNRPRNCRSLRCIEFADSQQQNHFGSSALTRQSIHHLCVTPGTKLLYSMLEEVAGSLRRAAHTRRHAQAPAGPDPQPRGHFNADRAPHSTGTGDSKNLTPLSTMEY